ncbi:MAG: NAD-dependent epimerase/dehydratase family protein [Actinomycetota bacterium]|nr:NAD-dependent epimerase/dehydratase family protein [Actinomycetota bacterium]
MKALVTGGAGFIGSHLVERLRSQGDEVAVIDNLVNGAKRAELVLSFGATINRTDISSPETLGIIEKFKPDVVFHLAAQMDVRHSVKDPVYDATVNIVGTLRILEGARLTGAKVIFTSSGGCMYGEQDPSRLPITEDTAGRPDSPYGISKKVVEDYLRFFHETHGVPFVSLALGNVYGPRQDPTGEAGVVAIFGGHLLAGEPCMIFGDGKQSRDYVFVFDVIDALMLAASKVEGETINIGTAIETSVNDLYAAMALICGTQTPPTYLPARPGELERSCLSNAKARLLLDWEPKIGLQTGLRATIDSLHEPN